MAYTKIHAIKATVHKAIDYICNPDKTDEGILISSYGCSPQTAHFDFKFALSRTNANDENKAYHLIQSFLPGEVDFDTAHQIGMELADKVLEGKYSYVTSTHIDKGHIHNHIIFCAADNIEHHKYNDCKQTYYRIRRLSDDLCKEHQLSVITPSGQRGKKYNEWTAAKNGNDRKSQTRRDINASIKAADTYEEFLQLMRTKGYQIKGESLAENAPKSISFLPPGRERFIRGSVKSLGAEYTKERINERIIEKAQNRNKPQIKDYSSMHFIDTTKEKFQENDRLKQWAEIENLKIAASAYNKVNSITELEEKISKKSALVKESRNSLKEAERKMKNAAEILKYAEQYKENRPYHIHYRKVKNTDNYFRKHESNLILYDGAKEMLRRSGIDLKTLDVDKLRSNYARLERQKNEASKVYHSTENELKQMNTKLDKLKQYLGMEQDNESENHKMEQSLWVYEKISVNKDLKGLL
ncbi:MAG: relaxase/mobilization nuclease domain-containing protein [Lachnospiraceae bacterium]|nr:relaxase/mobilization nuclease domain-containing protein [Lachnospiraceae bacterium]